MKALQRLRAEQQLTLRELEDRSGVSAEAISAIERGTRKAQLLTLAKLARALGVDIEQLVEEQPSPKVQAPPEEERRSLTAYELNAAHALDAFCSQLEEFLTEFLPENDDTPLGENLLNMQRYMARTAAALSLPYMESATMRTVMLPAATRFVELVRTLEEAAENSGAGADEETDNVIQTFELALAS